MDCTSGEEIKSFKCLHYSLLKYYFWWGTTHTLILVAISKINLDFLSLSSWIFFSDIPSCMIKPQLQSLNVFSKKWAIRFLQPLHPLFLCQNEQIEEEATDLTGQMIFCCSRIPYGGEKREVWICLCINQEVIQIESSNLLELHDSG